MQLISPLRELTCHTGSYSVTCHPTEVTFPPCKYPIYWHKNSRKCNPGNKQDRCIHERELRLSYSSSTLQLQYHAKQDQVSDVGRRQARQNVVSCDVDHRRRLHSINVTCWRRRTLGWWQCRCRCRRRCSGLVFRARRRYYYWSDTFVVVVQHRTDLRHINHTLSNWQFSSQLCLGPVHHAGS